MTEQESVKQKSELILNMLIDIFSGNNLDQHLQDVEESIKLVDEKILHAKAQGAKYQGFEDFRNMLFGLKYEILERNQN